MLKLEHDHNTYLIIVNCAAQVRKTKKILFPTILSLSLSKQSYQEHYE